MVTVVQVHWQRCLQGFRIPALISTRQPARARPVPGTTLSLAALAVASGTASTVPVPSHGSLIVTVTVTSRV